MIEWMLADVICQEFERVVGKDQYKMERDGVPAEGKAMHIGFGMRCGNKTDIYDVCHMYIFGPANYVYVAIQQERIDADGNRHIGPMEILSYHDSCWRDAIEQFVFKRRGDLNVFSAFKLFDWYDIVTLTEAEMDFLAKLNRYKTAFREEKGESPYPNPFDNRGIWAGKA